MPKKVKRGWGYIYSSALKQEVAVKTRTGEVYCEDGIKYSPEEIKIMDTAKQEISLAVHLIKKVIGGEIIDFICKKNQSQGELQFDDNACSQCQVLTEGFDCNCFQRKEQKND
jgi:hypothetical protein